MRDPFDPFGLDELDDPDGAHADIDPRDHRALVASGDTAALLRAVDAYCATRDWDDLAALAARCRDAIEVGRQLWAVALHIDYRLALEATPSHAAAVLRPGAGRFALGPLTEVAASVHSWGDLAPHLDDPIVATVVAQERVIRGEDLSADPYARAVGGTAELPLVLLPAEESYALPRYRDRSASFPQPPAAHAPLGAAHALTPGDALGPDPAASALEQVADAWASDSGGSVRSVVVSGDAAAATAALRPVTSAEALALLQWAGASGGAHGQRRGGAAGRFAAWWAAVALTGLPWPDQPEQIPQLAEDLTEALEELRWWRWAPEDPVSGWELRLAVADPIDGLAWAVEATDQLTDDELDPPTG